MQTSFGHLTYCSNIHPGVEWADHFEILKKHLPQIRQKISPDKPLAIGLRCANEASMVLEKPENLAEFKHWLQSNSLYTVSFNGFPYGTFHGDTVKDQVHAPDWTTRERAQYTKRLFGILSQLIPDGEEGGVSTSPLSYRHWWHSEAELQNATRIATEQMLDILVYLVGLKNSTGKTFHLDVEPEPDGLLNNGSDFFEWYKEILLPEGKSRLSRNYGFTETQAVESILEHIRLCYDVCHFAVSYESPESVFRKLAATGIRVGRIQVSSALRVDLSEKRLEKLSALAEFDEPVYLHQVVAHTSGGEFRQYADLKQALEQTREDEMEWRIHFHVPLFIPSYGLMNSTQAEIQEVLALQKQNLTTSIFEVETYTWAVLPESLQIPVSDSIVRELEWVKEQMENNQS